MSETKERGKIETMQQRSNRRSCSYIPLREHNNTEKSLYTEVSPIRNNKRSITTSPIVNINVVERKLFNLELEKQQLRAKNLYEDKQDRSPNDTTYSDVKKEIREEDQYQDSPLKEPLRQQPQPPMKKSPPRKKKSLKDLIYETNKTFYQVDSNKVKYKVGLSKKHLLSSKTENS